MQNQEAYNRYVQGLPTSAYGTATRYINFCPVSHVGINEYLHCNSCGGESKRHKHVDMLSVETFPNTADDLDVTITDLLCGTGNEACELYRCSEEVNELINMVGDELIGVKNIEKDDFEGITAHEMSIEEQLAENLCRRHGCCSGIMSIEREVTHVGKFIIVKQAGVKENGWKTRPRTSKKKRRSARPTSKLIFTDINLYGFEVCGLNALCTRYDD